MISRICIHCGKPFLTYACYIRRGAGKTCSRACKYASDDFRNLQSEKTSETMTPAHRKRLAEAHHKILDIHKEAVKDGRVPGWFVPSKDAKSLLEVLSKDWEFEVPINVGPVRVAIADLLLRRKNLIVEIDGSEHYQPVQRLRDAKRDERLRTLGWTVRRYTHRQVASGEALAALQEVE